MSIEQKQLISPEGELVGDYFQINGQSAVVCDGPLSHAYSQALNQLYKREYDPLTGVALESQANDEIMAKRLWLASKYRSMQFANDGKDIGMLFGVKESQTTNEDVINVVDSVSEMNDQELQNSGIIIERNEQTPISGENGEQAEQIISNPITAALEQYAKQKGIAVYHSLEQYLKLNA